MLNQLEGYALRNNLKRIREANDFSIAVLAGRIGISRQALYEIEKGNNFPTLLTAYKIAWFFDKKIEDVFKFYVEETTDDSGFT